MPWPLPTSRTNLRPGVQQFYAMAFAAQGLLVLDASSREVHRIGAPSYAPPLNARTSSTPR